MKHTRTLFTILSWPVYICIAAYLLIAAPLILGYHPVVVLSGSMEPAFPVGSIIYYKETPCDKIQAGEIVTFHAGDGGSLVTHRVVENNTLMGQFVTKGDANEKADVNPVSYEEFIGKLTLSIPYLGRLAQLFTSTSGKTGAGIVILAALLLHVIGGAVESFQNRKNKKHRDRE